jgi:hypothetical protein
MNGWQVFGVLIAFCVVGWMVVGMWSRWREERHLKQLGVVDVDAELEAEHEHAREKLSVRPLERPYDREEDEWAPSEWRA